MKGLLAAFLCCADCWGGPVCHACPA